MSVFEILGTACIAYGAFTMLMCAVGVVRFPDFYTRLHAAGKGDTLGQGLVLIGLIFVTGISIDGLKLVLIVFFIFILNSSSTHALARAAWLAGMKPWTPESAPGTFGQEGQIGPEDHDALFVPVLPAMPEEELAESAAEAALDAENGEAS